MSQQKILLVVCLFASLVAFVTGQNADIVSCSRKVPTLASDYADSFSEMMRQFTQNLSEEGIKMADIQGFSAEARKLIDQMRELAKTDQGVDLQRYFLIASNIARTQFNLYTYFIRDPSVYMRIPNLYAEFGENLLKTNRNFLNDLAKACLPRASSKFN